MAKKVVETLECGILSGGIMHRMCTAFGMQVPAFVDMVLSSAVDGYIDAEGKEKIRVLPPGSVAGERGAAKSDVLVVCKMPNQHESNTCKLHIGELGEKWQPYLASKGMDISSWRLAYVVPFRVPDYLAGKGQIKQAYVNEGRPLLAEVLRRVQPKVVVLFGAEALKGFAGLFDSSRASKVKFTDSRGTILDFPGGIKAVCCYSPSAVIKAPELTPEFQKDLDLVASLVTSGAHTSTRPPPEIKVVDTLSGLQHFMEMLTTEGHKLYALDSEWGADDTLRTIQLSWGYNRALVIHLTKAGLVPTELGANLDKTFAILTAHLKQPDIGILGHNARGDLKVLRRYGLDLMSQFVLRGFDTMLGYHLVPGNEVLDKQLELVAVRMLSLDRYDRELRAWLSANKISEEKLEQIKYGTVPDDILIPYGAMDAIATFELAAPIQKLLQERDVAGLYNTVIQPVNWPVLEMEENGCLIDKTRLLDLTRLFEQKVELALRELQVEIGWPSREVQVSTMVRGKPKVKVELDEGFNPDSPFHVREVLFGIFKNQAGNFSRQSPPDAKILNLTPVKATDDTPWDKVRDQGKENMYAASTDAESLGILSAKHPFAKRLQRYKFLHQIPKNFLQPFTVQPDGSVAFSGGLGGSIGSDGRLRTSFRLTLETGRYATSPNLQNLPKRQEKELRAIFRLPDGSIDPRYHSLRSCFIASPGCVLIEADWNQAELWTMGYLAKDDEFIHVLRTSDVHTTMMREMFRDHDFRGKRIGDYDVAELNQLRKEEKDLDSRRVSAKTVVFGIPYGRGGVAIAREVSREGLACSEDEAREWIRAFQAKFPKIARFLQACKDSVVDPGFVRNPFGRYRAFPATDDNGILSGMQREAVNFP